MVGDGSYLMLNSDLHTSVMLGRKLVVTVLDNRGYDCINRLQQACGGAPFNNLLAEAREAGFTGIEKGNKFPSDPAALQCNRCSAVTG